MKGAYLAYSIGHVWKEVHSNHTNSYVSLGERGTQGDGHLAGGEGGPGLEGNRREVNRQELAIKLVEGAIPKSNAYNSIIKNRLWLAGEDFLPLANGFHAV